MRGLNSHSWKTTTACRTEKCGTPSSFAGKAGETYPAIHFSGGSKLAGVRQYGKLGAHLVHCRRIDIDDGELRLSAQRGYR